MAVERQTRPVRVWMDLDIEEVRNHLLLIDDLYGSCGKCKHLGLNYLKDATCPGCKTTFKYLATNIVNPAETRKILNRIKAEKLPLTLLDRNDFERGSARDAVGDLFKS